MNDQTADTCSGETQLTSSHQVPPSPPAGAPLPLAPRSLWRGLVQVQPGCHPHSLQVQPLGAWAGQSLLRHLDHKWEVGSFSLFWMTRGGILLEVNPSFQSLLLGEGIPPSRLLLAEAELQEALFAASLWRLLSVSLVSGISGQISRRPRVKTDIRLSYGPSGSGS